MAGCVFIGFVVLVAGGAIEIEKIFHIVSDDGESRHPCWKYGNEQSEEGNEMSCEHWKI
jgi:hypothetical protein